MNVDLYSHHYDRLNVNGVDMGDGVALDFSARKDGAIHAHVVIELDEAAKRQLREVVRQWDRDDEARDRADEVGTPVDMIRGGRGLSHEAVFND